MQDRYIGCFLGLALGDSYGAHYEGGILERLVWKTISTTKEGKNRYTDDTQMSIDLAKSLIKNRHVDQQDLSISFANSYKWTRGYGPSAAKLLKKIKNGRHWKEVNRLKFPEGSYGNGAAMRAPILSLFFIHDVNKLKSSVEACSEITHAHTLAIEGAQLVAEATRQSLVNEKPKNILKHLLKLSDEKVYQEKLNYCIGIRSPLTKKEVIQNLGNGMAASESCITAIYFALNYLDNYQEMRNKICELGGDTDTICAMAGAIWGASNGFEMFSSSEIENLEDSELIKQLAIDLYDIVST